jgi:hypothetical protein
VFTGPKAAGLTKTPPSQLVWMPALADAGIDDVPRETACISSANTLVAAARRGKPFAALALWPDLASGQYRNIGLPVTWRTLGR